MKKFDPTCWREMSAKSPVVVPEHVSVRLVKPGALTVVFEGVETLYGYGTHFDFILPKGHAEVYASVDGVYFEKPETAVKPVGAPFTNADKRPMDSSVEAVVQRALRFERLRQRAMDRKRKMADAEQRARREEEGLQEVVQDEPDVEVLDDAVEQDTVEATEEEQATS
jgi:hypothetical protein